MYLSGHLYNPSPVFQSESITDNMPTTFVNLLPEEHTSMPSSLQCRKREREPKLCGQPMLLQLECGVKGSYIHLMERYWKRLFVPDSVSVSKIKRQWCKVVPKRVPDILKSVIFVSGYPKCQSFFVLPENNRFGTIGNEIF